MFNIGFTEMLIIGVLVLIFVGPNEIPELARVVGRFLNELRRAKDSLTDEFSKTTNLANPKNLLNEVKNDLNNELTEISESVKRHVHPGVEPGQSGENGPSYPPQDEDKKDPS